MDKIIAIIKETWDRIKLYFTFEDEIPENSNYPFSEVVSSSENETQEYDFKEPKYGYIFFNCNENKDHTSMNILHNSIVCEDTQEGKAALWMIICREIMFNRVKASIKYSKLEKIVKYGLPENAAQYLTYGNIIKVRIMD